MNRPNLDNIARQAKATGRRVARKLKQQSAPTVAKLCEEREAAKVVSLRVWGPYEDNENKYRLKIVEGEATKTVCFKTLEEAEAVKESLLARSSKIERRTIKSAIEEWSAWLAATRGHKEASAKWAVRQTVQWIPIQKTLTQISDTDAAKLYAEHVERPRPKTGKPPSPATHHVQLMLARQLWEWSIVQGYCRSNPWKRVTPIGRKPTGKPQLRIDEARRFGAVAMQHAEAGDPSAIGALLMMYLGLRQGEVAARVARDIDDDGRVLWIPSGKTKNAKRRLNIPDRLRPLVLKLAQTKRPDELLFYPKTRKGHQVGYYWLRVKRLCRLAGVPEICPHSLRGLHATLALEGGATSEAVARALGHGSFAVTAQHYASASSVANARGSRVADALAAHKLNDTELLNLLKSVPFEQLQEQLSHLSTHPAP
jgi:integrase